MLSNRLRNIQTEEFEDIRRTISRMIERYLTLSSRTIGGINNVDTRIGVIVSGNIQSRELDGDILGIALGMGERMYLIPNNSYTPQILAHELGHTLRLWHPFSTDQAGKVRDEEFYRHAGRGNTKNIMDYGIPNNLHTFWLWQWVRLNNSIRHYQQSRLIQQP